MARAGPAALPAVVRSERGDSHAEPPSNEAEGPVPQCFEAPVTFSDPPLRPLSPARVLSPLLQDG